MRDARASVAVGNGGTLEVGDAWQAPNGLDKLLQLLLSGLGAGRFLWNWQGLVEWNIIIGSDCFALNSSPQEDSQEDDNLGQHFSSDNWFW